MTEHGLDLSHKLRPAWRKGDFSAERADSGGEQEAREVCLYVIDNNLADVFSGFWRPPGRGEPGGAPGSSSTRRIEGEA
jgi:hypothetical protein